MRWFDRDSTWAETDERAEATRASYWRHIEVLAADAPPAIRALSTQVNLHDARILVWKAGEHELEAAYGWGDLQSGYFVSHLVYAGRLVGSDETAIAARLLRPGAEIVYDEVDYGADGGFEHRFWVWPEGDVTVAFSALTISTEPRGQDRPER